MMRFTLLPIGECFEYQSERYSKTGPLTAASLDDNRQRMIPRSALVKPLSAANTTVAETPALSSATVNAETVFKAFTEYHEACLKSLQHSDKNPEEQQQLLEDARRCFLERCGLV